MTKFFKKKNIIIIVAISIVIICAIYIVIKEANNPRLIINGETLSVNENKIYIDGAVKNPGVYIFKNGQVLEDLINAAGGLDENADLENIDLSYTVKSGEKIIVEYIKEDIYVEEYEEGEYVNINTATKEQLMNLDGIGEKMAEKIIEYREKNEFEAIEDIMNVPGIGESKFSNIKDKIIVE